VPQAPTSDSKATFDASVAEERHALIRGVLAEAGLLGTPAQVSYLAGGASNENYLVETGAGERYVVRLAARDATRFNVDRARGAAAHRSAAAAGVSPELVAMRLPEGDSLTRWVDGRILDPQSIREPGVMESVARALRRMHQAEPIDGSWSVFEDIARYAEIARAERLTLPSDWAELTARMSLVGEAFAARPGAPAMCHNDLQLPNVILGEEQPWLIDFEYAGMGNRYFDLGNLAVNAELDDREVERLVAAYFGAASATESACVRLMMFMAALREATWAVIAEPVLTLDWDYQAWAALYYDRSRVWSSGEAFASALELARMPSAGARPL
jgi:thiamine kinase-like enzyme